MKKTGFCCASGFLTHGCTLVHAKISLILLICCCKLLECRCVTKAIVYFLFKLLDAVVEEFIYSLKTNAINVQINKFYTNFIPRHKYELWVWMYRYLKYFSKWGTLEIWLVYSYSSWYQILGNLISCYGMKLIFCCLSVLLIPTLKWKMDIAVFGLMISVEFCMAATNYFVTKLQVCL